MGTTYSKSEFWAIGFFIFQKYVWLILKHFVRKFHQAWTSFFWRVYPFNFIHPTTTYPSLPCSTIKVSDFPIFVGSWQSAKPQIDREVARCHMGTSLVRHLTQLTITFSSSWENFSILGHKLSFFSIKTIVCLPFYSLVYWLLQLHSLTINIESSE